MTEMSNAPLIPAKGPDGRGYVLICALSGPGGAEITIEAGPRRGDWEIIGVGDRKLRLRCPISHKELDCDWFCYVVPRRPESLAASP